MTQREPRVLMLSHRNVVNRILARCLWFEFEDIIQKIDATEVLAPLRSRDVSSFDRGYRIASIAAQYLPVALNPGVSSSLVRDKYDLFFTACQFPTDLLYVNALKGWRRNCTTAVCWIDEALSSDLRIYKYLKPILSKFDHVIVSCEQVVEEIKKITRGDCVFVPPGVDALLFCPYPDPPARFIDVLSIGRRPDVLHARLVKAMEEKRLVYFYDTISQHGTKYGLTAIDSRDHRLLLLNLLKRSKCFVTYPGKFDDPGLSHSEEIIGARFFEGAAAGALMIGRRPRHPRFEEYFSWPQAVIDLDLETRGVEQQICAILRAPEWNDGRSSIVHSLLHNDWAYRWETVLKLAGLRASPALLERQRNLEELSRSVRL